MPAGEGKGTYGSIEALRYASLINGFGKKLPSGSNKNQTGVFIKTCIQRLYFDQLSVLIVTGMVTVISSIVSPMEFAIIRLNEISLSSVVELFNISSSVFSSSMSI